MSKPEMMFDKRLVHRLIKRGSLTQEEYDQYMANLPDVTGKSEPLVTEEAEPEATPGEPEAEPSA